MNGRQSLKKLEDKQGKSNENAMLRYSVEDAL